jgi:branched-chain amino acid transport system substrate-binding protein
LSAKKTSSWICNGEPKDGNDYPGYPSPHDPQTNYGADCPFCGLPREATSTGKKERKFPPRTPVVILAGVLLFLGLGLVAYKFISRNDSNEPITEQTPTTDSLISDTATNAGLISQGEKVLIDATPEKNAGATAFTQKDWSGAITQYQAASDKVAEDPESKIYLNNAKARQSKKLMTMAVVVPITANLNSAKEVLRGVALYQEKFNQSATGQLLEVAIVNNNASAVDIANDLIKSPSLLGIVGHGVGEDTEQALTLYETEKLAVLSPINTDILENGGQATLKTIAVGQRTKELLAQYLESVATTLADYAMSQNSTPSAIIFHESKNQYSEAFRQALATAFGQGKVIKEVDVQASGLDAKSILANASQSGANSAVMAVSKDKIDIVNSIIQANASAEKPLTLMGGDELYSPTILVEGKDAVKDLVLSVPWRFESGNQFANEALTLWKGRISWRTAAAYDVTQALVSAMSKDPKREGVHQQLQQGIAITGNNTDFQVFDRVPLVKAVPGKSGPSGATHQFEPVK